MTLTEKINILSAALAVSDEAEALELQQVEICERFCDDTPDNVNVLGAAMDETESTSPLVFLRGPGRASAGLRVALGRWLGERGIKLPGAVVISVRRGISTLGVNADGRLVQTVAEQAIIDEAARLVLEVSP
jgi:hypothetical protein